MTPDLWQRIKAVLEELDSVPPADRNAVLARLCAGDSNLRREVEFFLAENSTGTFIHGVIGREAASLSQTSARQERFGPYQLIRRIGQGGMGAVYEAVRVDDFRKQVALKIIKQGVDSDFARGRFLQERQLLATLEHPYIARLLDGGEADDGSPYLVLEFVAGEPITEYCAALDTAARLRLFLKVCEAVEHAHRNLVVHRDLKPANILVTAGGDPKLLDFGIAKLIEPGVSKTQTVLSALTPDYASPEQVRGDLITTASDVYSLGVILYQLLTGRQPYNLDTATFAQLDLIICQEPPAPPGLGDELDQILLMALRKEPERRYAGVQRFAEDIERYLDHRPVSARPDTIRYRAQKFVRRNWWQIAAVAAVILSLGAALGISLREQQLANRRFMQVRQLANRILFDFHDQLANTPGTVKARGMLVSTALEYLNSLSADAGGDPALQWELAVAYGKVAAVQGSVTSPSLGRPREAVASLRKALSLARSLEEGHHLDTGQREVLVGLFCDAEVIYRFLREYDPALQLGREAAAKSNGLSAVTRERALTEMAATLNQTGDLLGSVAALRQTLSIARDNAGRDPSWENRYQVVAILTNLSVAQHRLTRFEEAAAADAEGLSILRVLSAERPDTPSVMRLMGHILTHVGDVAGACDRPSRGQFQEAAGHYEEALALTDKLIKADRNDLNSRTDAGIIHNKIACSLNEVDPQDALPHALLAIQLDDSSLPGSAQFRAQPRISAADANRALGQFAAAEHLLKEAGPMLPPTDKNTRSDLSLSWARLEAARGNQAAAAAFTRAIQDADELFHRTPTPSYAWNLARALELAAAAADPASAHAYWQRILELWTNQSSRYPRQPYLEQRVAEVRAHVEPR